MELIPRVVSRPPVYPRRITRLPAAPPGFPALKNDFQARSRLPAVTSMSVTHHSVTVRVSAAQASSAGVQDVLPWRVRQDGVPRVVYSRVR